MGNLANKCLEVFDGNRRFDLSKEDNENGLSQEKSLNSSKNKYKKHNYYNINDILAPASTITNKTNFKNNNYNDDINNEYNIYISKIKKIQNIYHKHYLKNKFDNEIRPSLTKKTSDYINKLYSILSSQGDVSKNLEEYSPNNWQLYYPSDDKFFLFSKGDVYQNQIRIKNEDDINNIEIYEGEMNDKNMKHGYGILTNSHYILKGTWRNDEFTGWGIKCKRNGDNLEGKFIKGELNGKGIFKNGNDIYIGDFINNERYGVGDLTTDKFHYKGEFKNNKLEGKGEIEFFEDGIFNFLNNDKYEGGWKNGKMDGFGLYCKLNGNKYKGEWKNGKKEGFGIYYFTNGTKYEGEWKNDKRDGYGIFNYPDGSKYEGELKNNKINGSGVCFYFNGNKYEGEWKNNKREGYGIYYFSNGTKYKGVWKNNKKEDF